MTVKLCIHRHILNKVHSFFISHGSCYTYKIFKILTRESFKMSLYINSYPILIRWHTSKINSHYIRGLWFPLIVMLPIVKRWWHSKLSWIPLNWHTLITKRSSIGRYSFHCDDNILSVVNTSSHINIVVCRRSVSQKCMSRNLKRSSSISRKNSMKRWRSSNLKSLRSVS
jgi:hypothetical protein